MLRCCVLSLAIPICGPLYVAAQTTSQPAPSSSQPAATIRTSSDLVVVDVVATDSKQNPVLNLTASDFTVLESDHAQTIKVFEEHRAAGPAAPKRVLKLNPGTFTNYSPTPENGALNILLLDKLNTPTDAQIEVRQQVLKYLKQMPPGSRMAIFTLTTDLRMLQGFTSNPEILRALVEGKKTLPGGSSLMNNPMAGDEPGADDLMMDTLDELTGVDPDATTIQANLQQFEAVQQSFQLQLRARYTLDALNVLARYMSELPGRKNLIWFSGSFPVSILPDPDLQNPFAIIASAEEEFRETTRLLTRSQVAVYPIDGRGVMPLPMINVANSGRRYANAANAYAKDAAKFAQQTADEHSTMLQMAEATGGKAFLNTNDLASAIERAMDAGSNYYTIAYTPTDRNWNGKFRKIQVKLGRPGASLAYRRGYYADDPNAVMYPKSKRVAKDELPPYNALRAAMLHGGPDPTQLIFLARVHPSVAAAESEPAQGNLVSPKVAGPYRRYTVDFVFNPKTLNWSSGADGRYHCALQFFMFVYDAEGTLLNLQESEMETNLTASQYATAMSGNLSYRQQISVPEKRGYYLRLGMHDVAADHVGALELPIVAVAKLPPLESQSSTPASTAAPK